MPVPSFCRILALLLLFSGSLLSTSAQVEEGMASWYNDKFHGARTSSGEPYDKNKFTCAHRTLPFNTVLKVTNLQNGRTVTVKVNDRGPHKAERIVDLSRAAAEQIDLVRAGVARVKIEVVRGGTPGPGTTQTAAQYVVPQTPSPVQPRPGLQPNAPSRPVDLSKLPVVDVNGDPLLRDNAVPDPGKPQPTPTPVPSEEVEKYTPALFQMIAAKSSADGFGVQVGAFFSYYRLLEALDEINAKGFTNTLVHSSVKDGKPVFRIIVGPYPTQKDADLMRRTIEKKGLKGYVVNIRSLE
ncbi:MAG: hypothetical protein OHK0039_37960 [Bacteroidia bacterium]